MAEAIYRAIAIGAERVREGVSHSLDIDRRLVAMALAVALAFIGCLFFYVWAQHQVISLGYEISQASQEEQELMELNKKYRLELAALKSPGRMERLALNELGFVNPQKEQLIIVR